MPPAAAKLNPEVTRLRETICGLAGDRTRLGPLTFTDREFRGARYVNFFHNGVMQASFRVNDDTVKFKNQKRQRCTYEESSLLLQHEAASKNQTAAAVPHTLDANRCCLRCHGSGVACLLDGVFAHCATCFGTAFPAQCPPGCTVRERAAQAV